ncbi:nuclear transport factor 2 family protein [Candidatus Enterococcus ferrettii]|uniref:Nuclear transport factor 2 family protein n=1 Tax=Candidatus Enterococcus ferrettii TaxID=2815324 RepID=A0ABV0EQV3_9ENTE|nr:nuclear transport factor 2 family protein [Enterococcus sp. 665A]MBO1341109.1 nuclear transport factor 2 family protein [Enterococcus sp. 665A]
MNTVDKVVNAYIKGTFTGDTELLQSVFHEKARMTGYLGDQLLIGDPQPFIEDIGSQASMESNGDPYEAEVVSKVIVGNIADVTIRESGFRGSLKLEDHFHLIDDGTRWWIISKLFTVIE